jgi:Ca2+-binding RTX toxin-like protein
LNSLATDATAVNASTFIGNLTLTGAARVGTTAMTITGGDGTDTLAMKNAADVMDGAGGTDTLTITQAAILGGFQIDLSSKTDQVTTYNGSANAAVQKNFENINLSGVTGTFGADITGSSSANTIVGTANADQISGGAGADTITGGAGADTITLGAGVDTVVTTTGSAYTTATSDTITDFTVGTGNDILQIDISDSTIIASLGIVAAGDGSTAIAGNLVIKAMTAGTGVTLGAGDEIVVITGTLADSAALLTSIGTGAGIITKSTANTTTNGLLVAWNDGTNTYVSAVSDAGADAAMTTADLAATTVVTLVGVHTAFHTDNFVAVA